MLSKSQMISPHPPIPMALVQGTIPGKAGYQHQGLRTVTGECYPEAERAVHHISSRLYDSASGKQTMKKERT